MSNFIQAPADRITPPMVRRFDGPVVSGSFIVKLKEGVDLSNHRSNLPFDGPNIFTHHLPLINGYAGGFSLEQFESIMATGEVDFIEEDAIYSECTLTTQTDAPWGLESISSRTPVNGLPESLNHNYRYDEPAGQGVDIYIVDGGVFVEHEDFGGRAKHGWAPEGSDEEDHKGHGTHCASIAGGTKYGVAKDASIISVKVTKGDESSASDTISGFNWIADNVKATQKPSVVSYSRGRPSTDWTAVDEAVYSIIVKHDIPVAVAAGNKDWDAKNTSPAHVEQAITVAAMNIHNAKHSSSNWGSLINIWAPGETIIAAGISSTTATATKSGTSMAAPHVAGLIAYFLGKHDVTVKTVASYIEKEATKDVLTGIPEGTVNLLAFNGITA